MLTEKSFVCPSHAKFIPTPFVVYKNPLLFTVKFEIKKPLYIPIHSLLLITGLKLLLMKRLINSNNTD